MKLATYRIFGVTRVGLVHAGDRKIFDLGAAARRNGEPDDAFASMQALIEADDAALDRARSLFAELGEQSHLSVPVASARLLAPLPAPVHMRGCRTFARHVRQAMRGADAVQARRAGGDAAFREAMARPLPLLPPIHRQFPAHYIINRLSVVGPDATIRWPRYSRLMDYELEIAIVTKRTRADIPLKEAFAHIFGYTIFNDLSARDQQNLDLQGRLGPTKSKSFAGSNVLGPWIVTADEISDLGALHASVRVNGETRARSDLSEMLFSFPEILAYVSQDETVHAGEVFGSGCAPDCSGQEIGRFLEDGDIVELEVEKIGVLRNRVYRQSAAELPAIEYAAQRRMFEEVDY